MSTKQPEFNKESVQSLTRLPANTPQEVDVLTSAIDRWLWSLEAVKWPRALQFPPV